MKKLAIILVALSLCIGLGYGQTLAQPVNQMEIDPGTIGDLLLFAPYDVRPVDGRTAAWQNFLVIENTSDKWTAFHLRFRSWKKSIEVYDHVILLSPFDVFWGVIQLATADGQTREGNNQGIYPAGSNHAYKAGDVLFWSMDYETCYWSGLTYEDANTLATVIDPPAGWYWMTRFQPDLLDDCGFIADLNNLTEYEQGELQAGEFEGIGLWSLTNPMAGADTSNLHNVVANVYPETNTAGNPAINVFDVMNALYYEYTSLSPIARGDGLQLNPRVVVINQVEDGNDNTPRAGLDCGNVLAGAFSMGDTTTGRFSLSNMVAISNFRTTNTFYTNGHLPLPAAQGVAPWHRDMVAGGYIVFPIETLFWSWDATLDNGRIPYYVNENWATTVGPGLRDGDDWNGELQLTGGCGNWTIQPFNNMWSLDELEEVLANNEIWYHYFNNAFNSIYTTDVVIGFFAKHYHYFFADWPYWTVAAAPYTGGPPNAINTQAQYWRALYDYRGNRGASKIGGAFAYRSVEAGGGCNSSMTIAEWFQYKYANGKVQAYAYVWDMEENKPTTTPDFQPPPGSPWHPAPPPSGRYIHHEVNIIRVMAPTPTTTGYITDANGFLTNPPGYQYEAGHFALQGVALTNGQRASGTPIYQPVSHYGALDTTDYQQSYFLASIGVVIFDVNYANQGVTSIDLYRSAMAPWHYRLAAQ
ncbi:MAG: hypothetical protein C4582_10605 [Desulfobacteraceae bacterium]|nr:MAG: hypothetical protein C4582_10605 [Desulfobacteraceae bacterium]